MKVIWLNHDEFIKHIERSVLMAGLWNKEDLFSLAGINSQLSSIGENGILLIRTRPKNLDLEEFAVRKINGVWKFSLCSQEIEDVKYGRGAEMSTRKGVMNP